MKAKNRFNWILHNLFGTIADYFPNSIMKPNVLQRVADYYAIKILKG